MANDITPRSSRWLEGSSYWQRRELQALVHGEKVAAVAHAARLELGARVARIGLGNTAALSHEEATYLITVPHAEARLRVIVDNYAMFAAGEVTDMRGGR